MLVREWGLILSLNLGSVYLFFAVFMQQCIRREELLRHCSEKTGSLAQNNLYVYMKGPEVHQCHLMHNIRSVHHKRNENSNVIESTENNTSHGMFKTLCYCVHFITVCKDNLLTTINSTSLIFCTRAIKCVLLMHVSVFLSLR